VAVPAAANAETPKQHDGLGARRWIAIAAAAALVVAGVAAIAVNRGDDGPASTPPTEPGPTTREVTADGPVDWYVLASPDLIPGELVSEACCTPTPAPGPATAMAWGDVHGLEQGVLLLVATPQISGEPTLTYRWTGMTDERAAGLQAQVQTGSGLPYVLPDPSMELLGAGLLDQGNTLSQGYTNPAGTVTISVGDYRGQLRSLVDGFRTITIAGGVGYRTDDATGTHVVWRAPSGQWATLEIPPAMSDRADGLIGAVSPNVGPTITGTPAVEQTVPETVPAAGRQVRITTATGETLPAFDSSQTADPAVGLPAPAFSGVDDSGQTVGMDFGATPTLVLFTAPWCPHCRKTLPAAIASLNAGALGRTQLVIVDTASGPGNELYSHADVATWGYQGTVFVDRDRGDGSAGTAATAYGTTGYPYFVLVDETGKVVRRFTGEMTADELTAFVNG
jgi:thiol-disulfide isomerase/thioredoxin